MKSCKKCLTIKPLDSFSGHKATKDGLATWCRGCVRAYYEGWAEKKAKKEPSKPKKIRSYKQIFKEQKALRRDQEPTPYLPPPYKQFNRAQQKWIWVQPKPKFLFEPATEKLADDFNVLESTKDGLQVWCRACMLKYASEYRESHPQIRKYPELRIRGVGTYTKETLHNIAENKGIDFDVFIKAELANIIQNYPERMRQPKPKY